ncbi:MULTISPECIES: hypothetical protein [unclassified Moorena]|nr:MULTISPECIES: hypothetical protein [unclassified Moorena]
MFNYVLTLGFDMAIASSKLSLDYVQFREAFSLPLSAIMLKI